LPIFRHDLIELWRRKGLGGLEIKPVRIGGWYNNPRKSLPEGFPTYARLVTTSKVRLSEPPPLTDPCPVCGFVKYAFPKIGNQLPNGVQVDPASWDGSDFCGLVNYVFVFCTRRVAEVTLDAGYNLHTAFVRAENWGRWEEFDVRKWTSKAWLEYQESFLIRHAEDL
jgi:hypothetical protein